MNGHSANEVNQQLLPPARSLTPSTHLGKRKRSRSPEKIVVNGINTHTASIDPDHLDSTINHIIRDIRGFDSSPSILAHTIPRVAADGHAVKKQKFENESDNIETRLANHYYSSTSHLLNDLQYVLSELKKSSSQVNGLSNGHSKSPSPLEFAAIEDLLSQYSHTPSSSPTTIKIPRSAQAGQVITLRSNDGGLVKQLFTGLRKVSDQNVKLEDIDIRKLPSGLDIVDAAVPDGLQATENKSRTFGDVFRPARNLRPLDLPKPSRGIKDNTLNFVEPFESYGTTNKDDYRLVSLSAGSWLEYAIPDQELGKSTSHAAQLAIKKDSASLFKVTFSSFAPVQDSSSAVVSSSDRSRQWFRKYGQQLMRDIYDSPDSDSQANSTHPEIDDDYQQLIDTFLPASEEEPKTIPTFQENSDKEILEEISDLLQTLSSYQRLRDLDRNRVFAANTKPAGSEVDIYNLLRQQLELLVSALPPFAMAKLDGDQLKALNIGTNIIVATPDVAGTGQPDEGTLQRARQLQIQQQPATRSAQPRNSYTTATPTAAYNSQARSYNSNAATTPSMPGYAQRGVQMYNTPRPNVATSNTAYNQNVYQQRQQQPFPGATIQQFQRLQNGHTPNNQAPYQPRATQASSYQPPIQSSTQQYAPSAKPLVNGTPQPQQTQQHRNSYSTPTTSSLLQGPYAQANAHATIQQVKAAHQMQQLQTRQSYSQSPQPLAMQGIQQQRQGSGTPQPQLHPHTQAQSSMTTTTGTGVNGGVPQIQQSLRSTPTPTPVVGAGA